MHLTKSVDYAIVMEGELELHLDNGSCTVLHQGISPDHSALSRLLNCQGI